jgi:hypothetical protein
MCSLINLKNSGKRYCDVKRAKSVGSPTAPPTQTKISFSGGENVGKDPNFCHQKN